MRYFLIFVLCGVLLASTIARPSQFDERNYSEAEEPEYEGNEETSAEETGQEEEESRLNEQDSSDMNGEDEARSQRLVKTGRDHQQRNTADAELDDRPGSDIFADYSQKKHSDDKYEEPAQSNNDTPYPKRRQSNKYIDNSDVNDPQENVHVTSYKTNRVHEDPRNNELDKRTIESHISSIDDSDSAYESNRENRNDGDKLEYKSDVSDSSEQGRHFKQYYNTMQSEHKSMLGDRNYDSSDRDRRQAEPSDSLNLSSTSTEKNKLSDISNEDDEAAIKRHIRKLSGEELEELLNFLSDDKKALLNKIKDSDSTYETMNKREITKKAGAVDENSFIDSSLSEISKVQGGPSIDINTESAVSQSSDVDNNSKQQGSQTESSDTTSSKSSETTRADVDSKAEVTKQADDAHSNIKSDSYLNEPNSDSSNAQASKSESKRETGNNDVKYSINFNDDQSLDNYIETKDSDDSFNDQGHFCSQEDEMAQLMDEEALLHNNNEQQYKREVSENQDLDDSIKSLEESFPNSNVEENGQYLDSNMTPLIRVKRKNNNAVIKKRAADLPEGKVAYVPYRAENEDEDNEEGSEFEDDGFYDRTSNYAKNNAIKKPELAAGVSFAVRSPLSKQTNFEEDSKSKDPTNENIESDTMSLGSDTDSVLSGVEGVDDNLMYSSGTRNKRTAEVSSQLTDSVHNRSVRSTPALEEAKPSENSVNLHNYQESEAFGPLPRNEAELTRYKRIRRVKPFTPDK